jgi:chromosome segregation ATPase
VAARLGELGRQLEALEQLVPQLEAVQNQAENVAATQRRADVRLGHASETAERLQTELDRISDSVDLAQSLKKDLARFTELVPDTERQLEGAEALASRVADQVDTLEQHRDALAQGKAAAEDLAKRLEEIENHAEDLKQLDAKVMERAAEIRSHQVQIDAQDQATLEELAAIRAAVRKSLERVELSHAEFDSVQERMTALDATLTDLEAMIAPIQESQRIVGEMQSKTEDLSGQLHAVAEDCSGLDALEARVTEVRSLHADVLEQSDRIAVRQEEIDQDIKAATERVAGIRDDIGTNAGEVEKNAGEIAGVSKHVGELHEVLEDWERRFFSLDESRESIVGIQDQATNLSAQLDLIGEECGRLGKETEKIDGVRRDIGRLDEAVDDVEQRVVRIEEVRTDVDAMSRDLADLRRKSEAIAEAMRHAREAQNEISEMRDEQADTEKWIAGVQESVGTLQLGVSDLLEMKPAVESVREEAEKVSAAVTAMDSRREFLEEMDKRLGELEALGTRLAEGAPASPSQLEGVTGAKGGWRFSPDFALDGSTWEFGIQFRVAGRWKRGLAVWVGPLRMFMGWEKRMGHGAVAVTDVPAEDLGEEDPEEQR